MGWVRALIWVWATVPILQLKTLRPIRGQAQTTMSQFLVCCLHCNRTVFKAQAAGQVHRAWDWRCVGAGVAEAGLTQATGALSTVEARVRAKASGRVQWLLMQYEPQEEVRTEGQAPDPGGGGLGRQWTNTGLVIPWMGLISTGKASSRSSSQCVPLPWGTEAASAVPERENHLGEGSPFTESPDPHLLGSRTPPGALEGTGKLGVLGSLPNPKFAPQANTSGGERATYGKPASSTLRERQPPLHSLPSRPVPRCLPGTVTGVSTDSRALCGLQQWHQVHTSPVLGESEGAGEDRNGR